jgi:CubicO group peptidase (beta-lactamase class C family)
MTQPAPHPAHGTFDERFAPLARRFASQLEAEEIGAALCVYHRGRCVVELWGGYSNVVTRAPWRRDTRTVVFSVTKGLVAMAMLLLVDRGLVELDAPIAQYWPGFARAGKEAIPVRALLNHRAWLAGLDRPLRLADCVRDDRRGRVLEALEAQSPNWEPGAQQGYHALTYGMYVRELFERVTGERLGDFLRRELFEPLDSDARLGAGPEFDERTATLYPPSVFTRLRGMAKLALFERSAPELDIARDIASKGSLVRKAFNNPDAGLRNIGAYGDVRVRRSELAWASATASARGVARAYLPFSMKGTFEGRAYVRAASLEPVYERQSFSQRDRILYKPLGWSQGFLKEDRGVFGPTREAFGHAGIGGSLGWCDPVHEIAFGYVMNRLDWRVRSPRALALCRALYECLR